MEFDSFDIRLIPHTKNFDTSMLIDEDSNLNIGDGSIDMKFDVETYRLWSQVPIGETEMMTNIFPRDQ